MQLTEEQKQAINWRAKESFAYSHVISKPYGVLDSVLDWCKSECSGDWRWNIVDVSTESRPGNYMFYFDSEKDYCAFLLKWA